MDRRTDRQILREAYAEARRILRDRVDPACNHNAQAVLEQLREAIDNDELRRVMARHSKRLKFQVVKGEVAIDPEDGSNVILGPRRPAGSGDRYGVPKATE
jgi:hypothetical protein